MGHEKLFGHENQLNQSHSLSIGDYVFIVGGCTVGGSNFSGSAMPFLGKAIRNTEKLDLVAVEPSACPTLTKGKYAYDLEIQGK